jgi:hypothetical protein
MPPLYEVNSSEWWRQRLIRRLVARREEMALYDNYYAGNHRLAFASSKYREAFANLFRAFADNFCLLVVDAERERLNVEGFRVGNDREADADAWAIWQRNDLDARSAIAHTEALVKGICYVAVWRGADDEPLITIEDPMQVIVDQDFGGRGPRRAALKLWQDDDDRLLLTLYLPDRIEKWQSIKPVRSTGMFSIDRWTRAEEWEPREIEGEPWPLPNALEAVPIVPLVNNPRLTGDGRSEIAAVVPIQDAINKTIADMLVASEYGAFRQRWVTGIDIPLDENGRPVEPFRTAVDRLWVANPVEGGQAPQFGEFSQTDLSGYVRTVEMLVQHIASITKTPPHYLLGQSGTFPSGEALKSTETGLVAKTRLAARYFGEAWEEVIRLAFRVTGDERANITDSETIWRDPESKVQSELTDAVMKEQALGVPQEALWEKLGYSPQQIARFRRLTAAQTLLTAPPPPTPIRRAVERDEQGRVAAVIEGVA